MTVEEEDTHRNIIREGVGPRLHDRKFAFANRANIINYLIFFISQVVKIPGVKNYKS